LGWQPRPDIDWIRSFNFSAQFRHLESITTGITEERQWQFTILGVAFESQDNININLQRQVEFLDNPFDISDGIVIDVGDYVNWEWSLSARTASRRVVSVNIQLSRGGFWSGDRTQVGVALDFRPSAGVLLTAAAETNNVDLPQGSFDANLFRVEGEWNITPLANIMGNIQYDDVSEIVGLFMRARWILTPGNEIFFVFTQNWQNLGDGLFAEDREFLTLSRGASVKVNYTYRL
jgi:hypothetical protein